MAVLSTMDARGFRYSVLRNHASIPESPGRDIDLVAEGSDLPRVEKILIEACSEFGWDRLVRCRGHHEGISYYFLAYGESRAIQLELHFTRIRWAGVPILTTAEIIEARERSAAGLWVTPDRQVVLQRLLQFGLSGRLGDMKPEYWEETLALVRHDLSGAAVSLGERIGHDRASALADALSADAFDRASSILAGARVAFLSRKVCQGLVGVPAKLIRSARERWGRPFCGVLLKVQSDLQAHAVVDLVSPVFLNTMVVHLQGLNGQLLKTVRHCLNRVGLVVVVDDRARPGIGGLGNWGSVPIRSGDPEGIVQSVFDAFAEKHRVLHSKCGST